MLHLVFGDAHIPFHIPRVVDKLLFAIEIEKPDAITINGDFMDFYHLSRYLKMNPAATLQEEVDTGRDILAEIRRVAGNKCKIYFREGNHEVRAPKFLHRNANQLDELDDMKVPSLLRLEDHDIEWIPECAEHIIDEIQIVHGTLAPDAPGKTAYGHIHKYYFSSVAVNHCHRMAWIVDRLGDRWVTGLECGCLCTDDAAKDYRTRPNWARGWMWLWDGRFEPHHVTDLSTKEIRPGTMK